MECSVHKTYFFKHIIIRVVLWLRAQCVFWLRCLVTLCLTFTVTKYNLVVSAAHIGGIHNDLEGAYLGITEPTFYQIIHRPK